MRGRREGAGWPGGGGVDSGMVQGPAEEPITAATGAKERR